MYTQHSTSTVAIAKRKGSVFFLKEKTFLLWLIELNFYCIFSCQENIKCNFFGPIRISFFFFFLFSFHHIYHWFFHIFCHFPIENSRKFQQYEYLMTNDDDVDVEFGCWWWQHIDAKCFLFFSKFILLFFNLLNSNKI